MSCKSPYSFNNNRYLLVVQDYFTKWADAIAIPDQKATHITKELVKLFSMVGLPDILHSDQGQNFESTICNILLSISVGGSGTREQRQNYSNTALEPSENVTCVSQLDQKKEPTHTKLTTLKLIIISSHYSETNPCSIWCRKITHNCLSPSV